MSPPSLTYPTYKEFIFSKKILETKKLKFGPMRMLLGHIVPTNHRPAKKRIRVESLDDQSLIGPIET